VKEFNKYLALKFGLSTSRAKGQKILLEFVIDAKNPEQVTKMVQFLKGGIEGKSEFEEYGELKSLKKFRDFSLKRFGIKEWVVGKPSSGHIAQGAQALGYSFKAAAGGKYDLLIIDEILYAVQLGVIGEQGVLGLIAAKAPHTELVLTGSHKPFKKIFEKAGLITEMKKHKHPYDKGIGAREGIEF